MTPNPTDIVLQSWQITLTLIPTLRPFSQPPKRPPMKPVLPTVNKVLIRVPCLLARHSCCGHELADLQHKVIHFERCDTHPMTGVGASGCSSFTFLLNFPSSF